MKKKTTNLIIIAVVVVIAGILIRNRILISKGLVGVEYSAIPVTVTSVEKQPLVTILEYTGTIEANKDIDIVSETSGKVEKINVKVGDNVKANTVLIEVDSELKAAAFAAAETNFEKYKKDLERNTNLFETNTITESQFESVKLGYKAAEAQYITARRQLQDTKLSTPITGTITACNVDTGTMVSKDMVVAGVVDISKLKVKVRVPEDDVFKLAVGDTAIISVDVYPDHSYKGAIYAIGSKADEAHTYPLEILLNNDPGKPLKAGMFGRVTFELKSSSNSIVIPRKALVGSVKNPQVYVIENDTAKLRKITLGIASGLNFEIVDGLNAGEIVVVNGQYNLRDNSPVTISKKEGTL